MFETLPSSYLNAQDWTWDNYQPYITELLGRELTPATAHTWLSDYTKLINLINEIHHRLEVANTCDTTDKVIEAKLHAFLEDILPNLMQVINDANTKIVASGVQPENFALPLRRMQTELEIFREANLPLFTEEEKLGMAFDKIIGAQTIQWEGRELTIQQTVPLLQDADRSRREQVWRLAAERQLQDRSALNELWGTFFKLRRQLAANAGFADYRAYIWKEKCRFDYTPQDTETFHRAIEAVFVPAVRRLNEKRRQRLGLEALRPWDLDVDPEGHPPLRPFTEVSQLIEKIAGIFHHLDPQLGGYFDLMREEKLLDLDNRKGKAPGGYQIDFPSAKRPFIFMNAVGVHDDVQTMLHEGGHAFHNFEFNRLPYVQQHDIPMEFAEVASMSMELLGAPFLGDFYSEEEAARARIEHLEGIIRFLPFMAVVDGFQHWAYTHGDDALDLAQCDAAWGELWARFMPDVDWSGLEDVRVTGWHRKLHIFRVPFYYVEYGLAQVGSVQVWAKSLENPSQALKNYCKALSLGATASLPELYGTAGAKFAFDADTLQGVVNLLETTINELESRLR